MNGLFKKGKYWHFDFYFRKVRHQGSTQCTNHEKAKTFLSGFRTNLALRRVGLVEAKAIPTVCDFLNGPFLDSVKQNAKAPGTLRFYTERINRLVEYPPFRTLTLDKVTEIVIQDYISYRRRYKPRALAIKTRGPMYMPSHGVPTDAECCLAIATINA